MSIFLSKTWKVVKKYWQIFAGLFVGLGFALKMWWQLRTQREILQNEIETASKIEKVESTFQDNIETVVKSATEKHSKHVEAAKAIESKEKEKVKKDFDARVKSNKESSNEDLANKMGDSLDVNVVLPEEKNDL